MPLKMGKFALDHGGDHARREVHFECDQHEICAQTGRDPAAILKIERVY